jgi:hypothetical protein
VSGKLGQPPLRIHRDTSKLGQDVPGPDLRRAIMALRFLGKDPDSEHGGSPTVWEDGDMYLIQGWRVEDAATLAEVGDVPAHETILRIPKP